MADYRRKPLPYDDRPDGHRLYLSQSVIFTIDEALPKRVGPYWHENVLYVGGRIDGDRRYGMAVVAPEARTARTHYLTDPDSHVDAMRKLRALGLVIVAQVHCHPGSCVEHSDFDDEKAIVLVEGHWSLVIPDYGRSGMMPLERCGFHCFSEGEFRLLTEDAARQRVTIVPQFIDARMETK